MRKQCKHFKGVLHTVHYDDGGRDVLTDWYCDNKNCWKNGEQVGLLSDCEDCNNWEV